MTVIGRAGPATTSTPAATIPASSPPVVCVWRRLPAPVWRWRIWSFRMPFLRYISTLSLPLRVPRFLHALSVLPRLLYGLRHTVFPHVLAELGRPPIAVADRCRLARLLLLFDQLPHRVQPQLVFLRLAGRIVTSREVFEVNILEVVV